MTSASLLVVGAGIHGVHILARVISEKLLPPGDCLLVDPFEAPLHQWEHRTSNCTMDYLRSPASHGLSPDFRTIRRLATEDGHIEKPFTPPYHRPSVTLFRSHAQRHVFPVTDSVPRIRGVLTSLHRESDRWKAHITVHHVDASAKSTETVLADSVILALGGPEPHVPEPFSSLRDLPAMSHIHANPLVPAELPAGTRLAVVGGGIAAGHYLLSCSQEPIRADLWIRDRLTVWQFDSDPCFVGPRCNSVFSSIRNPFDRRVAIARARRVGSVPSEIFETMMRLHAHRRLDIIRGPVDRATRSGKRILISGADTTREYDHVVVATGFREHMDENALLTSLRNITGFHAGYPLPSSHLSLAPGLYVTGALAEMEVGPPARNIIGAHIAARRILPSLALRVRR